MPASAPDAGRIGLRPLATYCGPNPYGEDPCVVAALDFGREALARGPERCARIVHACAGWFAAAEPDWRADDRALAIAEFLAGWTLALLNKGNGLLHHARAAQGDGEVRVSIGYHHAPLTLAAIQLAADLFGQIETAAPEAVEAHLQAFWRIARRHHPDFQIRFPLIAARAAGVPSLPFFPEHRLWQFGWGRNGRVFFETEPMGDSAIGWKAARDKTAAKAIFASLGIRTAPHVLARSEADLAAAARTIGWPCVVKPSASGRSQGVTADVGDMAQLAAAFRKAQALDKGHVMIERQIEGEVHRIVVARGKTACIVRRSPPHVTGDGIRTVRTLIEAANAADAERRARLPELIGPIPLDEQLEAHLARQGLALDRVVPAGSKVMLRRVPMLESGAVYADVTAGAHPDIATMGALLAAALGLEFCGIDFISRDISRSCAEEGAVLEINTTPGMRIALVAGMSAETIGRLVLGDGAGRVPVTLVLAEGADLARLGAAARFGEGRGWVISDRCGLGGLALGEPAEPASADAPSPLAHRVSRLLRNPLVADLTIVCPPDALAAAGLPVDRFATVIACPCALDPAWREVLVRRTARWSEVADAQAALSALAAGDAEPASAPGSANATDRM